MRNIAGYGGRVVVNKRELAFDFFSLQFLHTLKIAWSIF